MDTTIGEEMIAAVDSEITQYQCLIDLYTDRDKIRNFEQRIIALDEVRDHLLDILDDYRLPQPSSEMKTTGVVRT